MKATAVDETITERWAQQRAHLEDLREQALADLRDMAELRRALTLDVHLSQATQADLDTLEATMKARTLEADQLRDSLAELDTREADEQAKAATAARAALKKDLDKALAALAKACGVLADRVPELAAALEAAIDAESAAGVLARRLDLRLASGVRGDLDMALLLAGCRTRGAIDVRIRRDADGHRVDAGDGLEAMRQRRTTRPAHHPYKMGLSPGVAASEPKEVATTPPESRPRKLTDLPSGVAASKPAEEISNDIYVTSKP